MDPLLLWWFAAVEAEAAPEPLPDIAYVDSASSTSTSVTIPVGHQAGDLMVIVGFTEGTGTPSPPGGEGWTLKSAASRSGAGSKNWSVYSKVATGSSETSGTWTGLGGTSGMICHVYRNASGIGAGDRMQDGNSNVDTPSLTLDVTDGSSWVMEFAMTMGSEVLGNSGGTVTGRQGVGSPRNAQSWDTNGGKTSWAGRGDISNSSTADWGSMAIEILKATT